MSGKVQTVLGDVSPSSLGFTLTHEHLFANFDYLYKRPHKAFAHKILARPTLETSGYIRQNPYSSKCNLQLNDKEANEAVIWGVRYFQLFGGGTIVENTTEGLERNIKFYVKVSQQQTIHIVAGTGYHIEQLQSYNNLHKTKEDLYDHMLHELTKDTAEEPESKAGFIGSIGSMWPLRDFERRAIQAAGELQPQVGCGVSFSPHSNKEAPFEIIRLYLEAGGSADKVVMSHLDRTLVEDDTLLDFAELGTYCQFSEFGNESSYNTLNLVTDIVTDSIRLEKMKLLIKEGRVDQLLMSHDIHTKHRLDDFGGHGFGHILNNVVPRMNKIGFSKNIIDKITIHNPARWLTMNNRT